MRVQVLTTHRIDELPDRLREALPEADVTSSRPDGPIIDADYLVGWRIDPERVWGMPSLRGAFVTGAGYDHLDLDAFPDVPVVRLIDPGMADDIALYCVSWIVFYLRDFDRFEAAQRKRHWLTALDDRFPRHVTVGVLGAGAIGSVVVERCRQLGFTVIGRSCSDQDRPLDRLFADCDVVVNVLPSTPDTRGIVDARLLAALGDGVLINVGRGATVDTDALMVALDGELRGAVLDVFETEPLPAGSPLWVHPKVRITPHVAGRSDPATAASIVAASIRCLAAGDRPEGTIAR